MAKFASVDDYMAELPQDRRATMELLRGAIRSAAPDATEVIAYNMPAFRLNGRFLVSYEAYRHHYSLFPWSEAMLGELGDELQPHAVGRGTIRFPADQPIPLQLVTRVVQFRLRELDAEAERRARR
ncbi:MAG TPA: DUF1801 domain-containing protein [Candidatus Angelobacter sp.]|nr:DUF1801 domain-containing protein [Candidatus Angelobacter sp.]